MKTIVFDIETVGEDFERIDPVTQDVLTKWIKETATSDEDYNEQLAKLKKRLGFSPLHGEIVAIGAFDVDEERGAVYYQAPKARLKTITEGSIKYEAMSEKDMLIKFWELANLIQCFVSFNGRGFDAPFLNIRSAIYGIRPSVDLMGGRYLYQQRGVNHIDLFDQLSYYGAVVRKGNLHLWCRAFGIKSPKGDGVDGDKIGELFAAKKYLDIAKYNANDLLATKQLYDYWQEYLNFQTN